MILNFYHFLFSQLSLFAWSRKDSVFSNTLTIKATKMAIIFWRCQVSNQHMMFLIRFNILDPSSDKRAKLHPLFMAIRKQSVWILGPTWTHPAWVDRYASLDSPDWDFPGMVTIRHSRCEAGIKGYTNGAKRRVSMNRLVENDKDIPVYSHLWNGINILSCRQQNLGRGLWPCKTGVSTPRPQKPPLTPPPPSNLLLTVPRRCFCCGLI